MKVFLINTVCGVGSTGGIVLDLYHMLEVNGHEAFIAYGRGEKYSAVYPSGFEYNYQDHIYKIGSDSSVYVHAMKSRLSDRHGFYSKTATRNLIKLLDGVRPDIIHLHNLHGYYLHIGLLFKYLKSKSIKVIWTLHDCWSFTGHCSHFDFVQCYKWKDRCFDCIQKAQYPKSILLDQSAKNYSDKKRIFTSLDNLTIVTPSKWLKEIVMESFLNKYSATVIQNGIDIKVFRARDSSIRRMYQIEDKILLLGVSNQWNSRKGLEQFVELSARLSADYQILLIGLTKAQCQGLPDTIIGIERTASAEKLAEYYSAADIYINTSVEETMGLTTLEAMACETPVIVFNCTAIPELVNNTCGIIVDKNNIDQLYSAICDLAFKKNKMKKNCREYAISLNKNIQYQKYLELYKEAQGTSQLINYDK